MINDDVETAVHWWFAERNSICSPRIRYLIPEIIKNVQSLYYGLGNFDNPLNPNISFSIHSDGKNCYYFNLPITPQKYFYLRGVIALLSDIYFLAEILINDNNLQELEKPLKNLYAETNKFREARNFFTHLNERLSNTTKHGITGELSTNCGINYGSSAIGCFHLILIGNILHFTNYGKAEEIDLSRESFEPIFEATKEIYKVITSHSVHEHSYESPDKLFY